MSLKQQSKAFRQSMKIAGKDLFYRGKRFLSQPDKSLSAQEQGYMQALRRDGVVAIPGYWPREKALALNEKIKPFLAECEEQNRDYPSGAYARFMKQERSYGEGIQRLYHAEREFPELADFRFDPLVLKLVSAYYGRSFYSQLTLFQHNPVGTEDGKHHIDGFVEEFKSFLYLDDVDQNNGPFTYLKGSHTDHWRRMKRHWLGKRNGLLTDFLPGEIQDLVEAGCETQMTGPAGTLLLVDVRGIHYGSPQRKRSRSLLVNYILPENKDSWLGK